MIQALCSQLPELYHPLYVEHCFYTCDSALPKPVDGLTLVPASWNATGVEHRIRSQLFYFEAAEPCSCLDCLLTQSRIQHLNENHRSDLITSCR